MNDHNDLPAGIDHGKIGSGCSDIKPGARGLPYAYSLPAVHHLVLEHTDRK